ncbi:MAG TPA: threonine/serine dehydratase, partial [Rhizomicrobium sp.]|nr:threonine/serine dehydratase [Rhizomicrobium sp.]
PVMTSRSIDDRAGCQVFFKCENFQLGGAFKIRGASNLIFSIPRQDLPRGVVAFSSGNHAQAVAAMAQLLNIPALIVMPADAPKAKIEGTRAYGAAIVTYDRVRDDREAIAEKLCKERGATLIKPYDDPQVIAGQGTVGLEIAEDAARMGIALDAVAAPCSGGGLVAGIALALEGAGSAAFVHSVEPEDFDGMRRSLKAHARSTAPGGKLSIADALMAPTPGHHVFAVADGLLAPGLAVSDEELARAVAFAASRLKLVVEPGGAAALAAFLAGKMEAKTVVLVISGGNADFSTVTNAVQAHAR